MTTFTAGIACCHQVKFPAWLSPLAPLQSYRRDAGTQQGGPAREAMHAPSLDGQRTGQARCQSSTPAIHVTVGPGADRVRPQEGQSCVFFIKPSHLRHRHLRLAE
jgi:hypothetical protein